MKKSKVKPAAPMLLDNEKTPIGEPVSVEDAASDEVETPPLGTQLEQPADVEGLGEPAAAPGHTWETLPDGTRTLRADAPPADVSPLAEHVNNDGPEVLSTNALSPEQMSALLTNGEPTTHAVLEDEAPAERSTVDHGEVMSEPGRGMFDLADDGQSGELHTTGFDEAAEHAARNADQLAELERNKLLESDAVTVMADAPPAPSSLSDEQRAAMQEAKRARQQRIADSERGRVFTDKERHEIAAFGHVLEAK